MPGVSPLTSPWVTQWLELQSRFWQSSTNAVFQQSITVCGHQMRHGSPLPSMAMQPQATVHRVDHPVAPSGKLPITDSVCIVNSQWRQRPVDY
jgi:hypothetical protein